MREEKKVKCWAKCNPECLYLALGVEDGQTVRMPVGRKEIFITFRVRTDLQLCHVMSCLKLAGRLHLLSP